MTKPTENPFKDLQLNGDGTITARLDKAETRAATTDFYTFQYRHRETGKVEIRRVAKDGAALVLLSEPSFTHEAGFFLTGHCMDRNAIRSFALVNMVSQMTVGGNALLVKL